MGGFETGLTGGIVILILLAAGLVFVLYLVPIPLWIAAWASGAYVGLFTLIGMRLRRVAARHCHYGADQFGQSGTRHSSQRSGSSLPGGGKRREGGQRHDFGGQGQHRFAL